MFVNRSLLSNVKLDGFPLRTGIEIIESACFCPALFFIDVGAGF